MPRINDEGIGIIRESDRCNMGTFVVPIEVGDPAGDYFEPVEAMVDTGAFYTMLPSSALHRLGVEPEESESFELADGSVRVFNLGETRVRVEGREVSTVVVFGGEDVTSLLGAYTLERLRLVVDPRNQRLMRITPRL